ncbi:lysylphosphatidylglycerol synthase domain-containing protein [Pantanalinema rosaneae CENA516]|uniref:lysylphosphatidylglycerol synthase domain-containing protein n=1 Tax=Pantanalinema rosaneae TaxID=1620701 RepID=UPI003D6F8F3A
MKAIGAKLKPWLRWAILGGTLFFLAKVLKENWQSVTQLQISASGWAGLAIALGVTLLAHTFAGWVWSQILRDFRQPIDRGWIIQAYLKTNIAKYLPGNIWHYYGRITAATTAGASLAASTVSVLLEPLLMAASALLIALLCSQQIVAKYGFPAIVLQVAGLVAVLLSVHPIVLNQLIQRLSRAKVPANREAADSSSPFRLDHYPIVPLLGELGFLLLRGLGFLITFLALSPIAPAQILLVLSAFSVAWLLGLVVPGAPGGIGVFEATAIALLDQLFSPGVILSVVACYRLISILAETAGAGLAQLDAQLSRMSELGK